MITQKEKIKLSMRERYVKQSKTKQLFQDLRDCVKCIAIGQPAERYINEMAIYRKELERRGAV